MRKMERKVITEVDKMRKAHERKLRDSALARAQHDLTLALAVEDYESASCAQLIIEQEEARSRRANMLPRAIGRRLDLAWLLVNIASRVSTMRLFQQHEHMKNPHAHLEQQLRQAVEEQSFEQAVQLSNKLQELDEEDARRDVVKMNEQLTVQLRLKKIEMERLLQDTGKRLKYELEQAMNAEDFETASRLLKEIKHREMHHLFTMLGDEIRKHKELGVSGGLNPEKTGHGVGEGRASNKVYLYGGLCANLGAYDEVVDMMEAAVVDEDYVKAAKLHARLMEIDEVARLGNLLHHAEQARDWETAGEWKVLLV